MAMNSNERHSYDSFMRDGDWHMSAASRNLSYNYFSEAKNHYWHAANCYKEAANIARSAGDYAESTASSKQREAEREFSDVKYKEEKYYNEHCR